MANGFISFNDYLDLNQGTEEELLQRAMADAETKDRLARDKLRGVEREGMQQGASDITQVTSYGDYLELKKGAADAWSKLLQSADPRQKAVLETLGARLGVGAKSDAANAARGALEEGATSDLKSLSDSRAKWTQLAQQKAAADAARAKADAETKRNFFTTAYNNGPANQGGFLGGPGGNEDRQRWAQMMESGLGAGAFELPTDYAQTRREDLDRWAWGTPIKSAVGTGRVGAKQQRDAFGRVIDAKTGRPLYGLGETGD